MLLNSICHLKADRVLLTGLILLLYEAFIHTLHDKNTHADHLYNNQDTDLMQTSEGQYYVELVTK